jgi:hypothetical protein
VIEDPDDFKEPYLPERYRKKVRENRSRRLRKKLILAGIIIAVAAAAVILVSGIFSTLVPPSPVPLPTVPPSPVTTAPTAVPGITGTVPAATVAPAETRTFVVGPGVPVQASDGIISLDDAVSSLRGYYPEEESAISGVNFSTANNRTFFGFTLTPTNSSLGENFVVFIDATTGEPYAPGQGDAVVTAAKAKILALSAFPGIHPEQVKVWYANDPIRGGEWQFLFLTKYTVLAKGNLDATTGDTTALYRVVPHTGRPTAPSIDRDQAKVTADKYISDHNGGPLPLNMTMVRYEDWGTASDPAAGQYVLTYQRIFQDFPVDTNRIVVTVDSVTGQVIGYDKIWTTQDYAFSQTLEQAVAKREATYAVMQAAKNLFPESVESVRIISAEIRWNNGNTGGVTERPGSVPLAWKVIFDDATIRAGSSMPQAVGWVDIQTGNVMEMVYRH